MEHDKFETVSQCIRESAQQAAASGGLLAPLIEQFLRTGEETWDGAGSGRFTLAGFNEHEAYTRASKTALRSLFGLLAELLTPEARATPQVSPETIRPRIEPMVKGLVQDDWQEVALRERIARTFVLNLQGARAAMDAELATSFMGTALTRRRRVRHRELFAFACEAYSRVVLHGGRKSRIAFAEKMHDGAFSFPRSQMEEVALLILGVARARNGWHVIRDATVIHRIRRRGPKP